MTDRKLEVWAGGGVHSVFVTLTVCFPGKTYTISDKHESLDENIKQLVGFLIDDAELVQQ